MRKELLLGQILRVSRRLESKDHEQGVEYSDIEEIRYLRLERTGPEPCDGIQDGNLRANSSR